MVVSKTRIWRGGLAEIMRGSEGREDVPQARVEAQAHPPSAVERPVDAAASGSQASSAQRAARSNRATLVGHMVDLGALDQAPRTKALSTTRVVPIESLLSPRASIAPSAYAELAPQAAEPTSAPTAARFLPRKLSMLHVRRTAIALLALFVLGSWFLRGQGPTASTKPAPIAPPQRVRVAQADAPQEASVERVPATAHDAAQPRRAVDALASGDYVAAQRLYADLAQQVEGRSAYAEAARILAERLQSKSER